MHWETSVAPALNVTEGGFPFNTRATPVMRPIPGLPDVDFVMAVDYGRLAVHNASAGAGDRNLSHGWRLLPWNAAENGGFSACPSIHWAEEDGYFYSISGGHIITLARSLDLKTWLRANRSHMSEGAGGDDRGGAGAGARPFLAADPTADSAISPLMGFPEHVEADKSRVLKADLLHPECWDHNVNDVRHYPTGLS